MTPGGIEAQEAAGQATFVANATLPKHMLDCTREMFELLGIAFGDDVDDLFVKVTLPPGWKKVATDHAMWTDLLDDVGRKRATIFYKAAFYDRNAHISLLQRYGINGYFENGTDYETQITDCDKPIHLIATRPAADSHKFSDAHHELAVKWLDEHFPNWRDQFAYWNNADLS